MQNTIKFTKNRTADLTRNLSPAVWEKCPIGELIANPGVRGNFRYHNFHDMPLVPVATAQATWGPYKVFADAAGTINRISAVNSVEIQGGALEFGTTVADQEFAFGDAYASYLLSGLSSNSGKLWWEACYAQNSILTNMGAVFLGLGEVDAFTFAAGVPMNNGDAISAAGSMIGFRIEEDGLGVIDTVYSDRNAGLAFTNIGDAEGGVLVANTFKKVGFIYDPEESADCVTFYADNVVLPTHLTRSALMALTNLDANSLGLLLAGAADTAATAFKAYLKWWAVAQLFPGE